jgi:hypothetical protein
MLFGIFFISFISAYLPHPQNADFDLTISSNNATQCNTSYIQSPNGTLEILNLELTQDGTTFYSIISSGNFSELGITCIGLSCTDGTTIEIGNLCREVTPDGKQLSTSESILYFLFTIVLLFLLVVLVYFIFTLPAKNISKGRFFFINWLKYFRIFLIAITYPIIMIILNLMNGLAVTFTTLSIFSGTIGFLFEVMLRGAWVFTVLIVLWIFYLLIKDSNFKKHMRSIGGIKI